MTGTLPLMPEHIFVPISPRLPMGKIKHHIVALTSHAPQKGYFGKNRAVNPVLFWTKLNTQNTQ
jgi:hypothetical protein